MRQSLRELHQRRVQHDHRQGHHGVRLQRAGLPGVWQGGALEECTLVGVLSEALMHK